MNNKQIKETKVIDWDLVIVLEGGEKVPYHKVLSYKDAKYLDTVIGHTLAGSEKLTFD
jgi:hypothetical protein|tara:strand:- start:152 stop:325 length:174 start_codon:yes stop_codon:yes gene_type:complete